MRTRILAPAILLLASIAPLAAQSAGSSRDRLADDRQRALLERRLELESAMQQMQELRADRAAASMDRRVELEMALQAAQLERGAAASMDARIELEATLQRLLADRESAFADLYRDGPRASWAPQDPADSLWRRAREQLNAGQYAAAVKLFHQIRTESRFSRSTYRPDAFYWEAFALTRSGGNDALRQAKQVLDELNKAYPASQRSPDAKALATRIDAELAGQGSEAATRELYSRIAEVDQSRNVDRVRFATQTADARAAVEAQRNALAEVQARNLVGQSSVVAGQVSATTADAFRAYQQGVLAGVSPSPLSSLGYFSRTSPQCRNDDEEIRLIALNALVEMDDSAAQPALREVLARRDECAPQLRRQAMMIIARKASPGTEALALEAARNDPDPEVRQMALTWLIEKDNAQALDVARTQLRSTEDARVRQAAVMALARSKNDRARTILRDFVRSDAPVELRGEALMALPFGRNADDGSFLRTLYGESSDKKLKEYALMALGRRTLQGDVDWLLGIAQDETEDIDLRTQAVWMLRSDASAPATAIAAIYDRPGDRKLREAALMIIAERSRNDAAALDKLIDIARNEKDGDLRRQAVSTLVRSRDPKAEAVLLEIIRKK